MSNMNLHACHRHAQPLSFIGLSRSPFNPRAVLGLPFSSCTMDSDPCRLPMLDCFFFTFWFLVFTARCIVVQSAVLRLHVVCLSVCLSVRPSVTLVNCDHIGWNSSKIISPLVSIGRSFFATPIWRVCSKGNTPKFGPKVTHPLLIWASETFDRKLQPNGYR